MKKPAESASVQAITLSHFTLLISKFFPYPPPIIDNIPATSAFCKQVDSGFSKQFKITPLIGKTPCVGLCLYVLNEPLAESVIYNYYIDQFSYRRNSIKDII